MLRREVEAELAPRVLPERVDLLAPLLRAVDAPLPRLAALAFRVAVFFFFLLDLACLRFMVDIP